MKLDIVYQDDQIVVVNITRDLVFGTGKFRLLRLGRRLVSALGHEAKNDGEQQDRQRKQG